VHLSPIGDGMWRLDGLLPAEVGTQFAAVLDAARRRLRAEARDHERINGAQGDVEGEFARETCPNGDDFDQVSVANSDTEVIGNDVLGQPIYADETPVQARDNRLAL
jgi:hypothetical protein